MAKPVQARLSTEDPEREMRKNEIEKLNTIVKKLEQQIKGQQGKIKTL